MHHRGDLLTSISHILEFGPQNIKHQYWCFLRCPRSYFLDSPGTAQSMDWGQPEPPIRYGVNPRWIELQRKLHLSLAFLLRAKHPINMFYVAACVIFIPTAGSCSRPHKWTGISSFFFGACMLCSNNKIIYNLFFSWALTDCSALLCRYYWILMPLTCTIWDLFVWAMA